MVVKNEKRGFTLQAAGEVSTMRNLNKRYVNVYLTILHKNYQDSKPCGFIEFSENDLKSIIKTS